MTTKTANNKGTNLVSERTHSLVIRKMKPISLASAVCATAIVSSRHVADAFTQPNLGVVRTRSSSSLGVNLPRVTLPDAVTSKLDDFDLKNPNEMDAREYDGYSGAAIAGTLLFFLLPGAILTGVADGIGDVAGAALPDFAISAIVGGGLAIYLSLKPDENGEAIRGYGKRLLDAVGLPTLRYDLPSGVTDVMQEKLGLMDPNALSEEDYAGYSGAAVAGTLAFFLLPGALVTGLADGIGDVAGAALPDFALSALIGGGLAIYLSLRDDQIAFAVNGVGTKLLDTVDSVLEGSSEAAPASVAVEADSATEGFSEASPASDALEAPTLVEA